MYKYIYFRSPLSLLSDLARHSPEFRSPPSSLSLIQLETKYINCDSVCIKREKIVYTHANTYIFVLHTYNYTIQIFHCLFFFCLSLFLVLYIHRLYNWSFIYNCFLLYVYSKLYNCFLCICIGNYTTVFCICIFEIYIFMFVMERNYTNFVIAYKYEFWVCYMWKLLKKEKSILLIMYYTLNYIYHSFLLERKKLINVNMLKQGINSLISLMEFVYYVNFKHI